MHFVLNAEADQVLNLRRPREDTASDEILDVLLSSKDTRYELCKIAAAGAFTMANEQTSAQMAAGAVRPCPRALRRHISVAASPARLIHEILSRPVKISSSRSYARSVGAL
jgi:hypothetical protein